MPEYKFSSQFRFSDENKRLRVKDIDFEQNQIIVRDGKGMNDRVTVLPDSLKAPLREHLKRVPYAPDARDRSAVTS